MLQQMQTRFHGHDVIVAPVDEQRGMVHAAQRQFGYDQIIDHRLARRGVITTDLAMKRSPNPEGLQRLLEKGQ